MEYPNIRIFRDHTGLYYSACRIINKKRYRVKTWFHPSISDEKWVLFVQKYIKLFGACPHQKPQLPEEFKEDGEYLDERARLRIARRRAPRFKVEGPKKKVGRPKKIKNPDVISEQPIINNNNNN